MKRFFLLVLVIAVCLLTGCESSISPVAPFAPGDRKNATPVPAGFSADVHAVFAPSRGKDSARWPSPQPLFARDLSNADLQAGAWSFNAEGVLAPTRTAGAKPNGDLWTKETYGDFAVSLEFRTQEKSNSGVFIRATDIVNWLQNSIEIQILQGDDDKPVHLVGAIFDVAPPARQVPITPGEWYRYVIVAKGNMIRVVLNGEEVNRVNLDQWQDAGRNPDGTANKFTKAYKDMARSGRIGLQDHGSPIEFRNLFVERL